ncbi:MAG: hypothetical protein KF723_15865 [Rhizobiaceae bacterium]|nr:hypothetical protein [Rhizobiaceae bacterium]
MTVLEFDRRPDAGRFMLSRDDAGGSLAARIAALVAAPTRWLETLRLEREYGKLSDVRLADIGVDRFERSLAWRDMGQGHLAVPLASHGYLRHDRG